MADAESDLPDHRRREHQRHPCVLSLEARCSSWDSFHNLFSENISERGLYIPTAHETALGETITIQLQTPDGGTLPLRGAVVHRFTEPGGQQRGLGIRLEELDADEERQYQTLVAEAATKSRVLPASSSMLEEPAPPQRGLPPAPRATVSEEIPIFVEDTTPTTLRGEDREQEAAPSGLFPESSADGEPTALFPESSTDGEPTALFREAHGATTPHPGPAPGPSPSCLFPDARLPQTSRPPPPSGLFPDARLPQDSRPPPPGQAAPAAPRTAAPPPPPLPADVGGPAVVTSRRRAPLVGMDFGTSMSSVAIVQGNEVIVLQTRDGRRAIPSVTGFRQGTPVVGVEARELLLLDPRQAIASPKRLLGRLATDRELEPFLAGLALPHSVGRDGQVLLHPEGSTFNVPQVCAPILFALRQLAETFLGHEVRRVVLTAPVSFDDLRLQGLREAARLAGLQVAEIVDEPTAAAHAYSFDPDYRDLVAVYDFGGGTFDFSVVDVKAADPRVLGTAGDSWLGGDDLDEAIARAAANAFWRQTGIELQHQAVQWQRLMIAAEGAKRALSAHEETILELPQAALTNQGHRHLRFPLTRRAFAELAAPIIERSLDTCQEAFDICEIKPADLKAVYLSGGTAYVPAVREAVARFFGKPGRVSIPPERAVVIGAAMFAAQAQASRITL